MLVLQGDIECFIAMASDLNITTTMPYCLLLTMHSVPSLMLLKAASISARVIKAVLFVSAEMHLKCTVLHSTTLMTSTRRIKLVLVCSYWANLSSLLVRSMLNRGLFLVAAAVK